MARLGLCRRIREEASLSVRELAPQIPASPASLSRWERGQQQARPEIALRWLAVLDQLRNGEAT